jgi:hypothetical protein
VAGSSVVFAVILYLGLIKRVMLAMHPLRVQAF